MTSMTRVLNLADPFALPFPILGRWPQDDNSVDSICIDTAVMVAMPFSNVLAGEEDPLTHTMSEANRVMVPGGTLEIRAPYHLCPHGIGHPFQQRIYNEPVWYAYGCPTDVPHSVTTKNEETGEVVSKEKDQDVDPNVHPWNWWHRIAFGVKMWVISIQHDSSEWTVFYQKFLDGEHDG